MNTDKRIFYLLHTNLVKDLQEMPYPASLIEDDFTYRPPSPLRQVLHKAVDEGRDELLWRYDEAVGYQPHPSSFGLITGSTKTYAQWCLALLYTFPQYEDVRKELILARMLMNRFINIRLDNQHYNRHFIDSAKMHVETAALLTNMGLSRMSDVQISNHLGLKFPKLLAVVNSLLPPQE